MPDPDAVREAVRAWLDKASADLAAARVLLEASDIDPEIAGYHAQQAAEKALKAVLVHRGIEVPRTHDLERLGAMAMDLTGHIGLPPSEALGVLTVMATASRYPDGEAAVTFNRVTIEQAIETAAEIVVAARLATE